MLAHTQGEGAEAAQHEPGVKNAQAGSCRFVDGTKFFRDRFFPADYKACEDIVVTGQVLRPAVQDNIAAKFQRALEIWGEERIVNDDQKTLFVGKFCQGAQVGDFHGGICRCFQIDV